MSSNKCNLIHLNKLLAFGNYISMSMNLNRAFASKLSKLLTEKNMSKYKLEKETGLTYSALRYIFNEVDVDIKFSTIVKVCIALNISLSDIFNDELFNLENFETH